MFEAFENREKKQKEDHSNNQALGWQIDSMWLFCSSGPGRLAKNGGENSVLKKAAVH